MSCYICLSHIFEIPFIDELQSTNSVDRNIDTISRLIFKSLKNLQLVILLRRFRYILSHQQDLELHLILKQLRDIKLGRYYGKTEILCSINLASNILFPIQSRNINSLSEVVAQKMYMLSYLYTRQISVPFYIIRILNQHSKNIKCICLKFFGITHKISFQTVNISQVAHLHGILSCKHIKVTLNLLHSLTSFLIKISTLLFNIDIKL